MMKIMMICTVPFSMTGIPIHIRNYYIALNKEHKIDIVAPEFDYEFLDSIQISEKTTIHKIPRNKNVLKYILELNKYIKDRNYNIIHIHGNSSTMVFELLACIGSSAVKIVHGHNSACTHKIVNVLLKPLLFILSDMRFACSTIAGDWLYGSHRNYYVINNGIDISKFFFSETARERIRKKYNIKKNCLLLGHVGTFNKQKNHDFFVGLAKKMCDMNMEFKFMLVGGGNSQDFEDKIAGQKLTEYFLIEQPVSEIEEFYSAFDVFLLPSKWEGLGMVVVEAQYAGLKTIVSDAVPKEVQISNLVSFLPLSEKQWMKEIFQNRDINDRREEVLNNKFDISICCKNLIELYQVGERIKNEHKIK